MPNASDLARMGILVTGSLLMDLGGSADPKEHRSCRPGKRRIHHRFNGLVIGKKLRVSLRLGRGDSTPCRRDTSVCRESGRVQSWDPGGGGASPPLPPSTPHRAA